MTTEVHPSFDLITRPWVPVVDRSGERRVVSLARLLLGAHTLRRIAGQTPPMTAALHRLVLALLHRVYGPPDADGWARLWTANRLPSAPLRAYLNDYRDRFDLFHPERPFLQCRELRSLTPASPAKLVPFRSVGNNVTLFDHTTAADRILLKPEEAAQWLVTALAFDPGGMKTPYTKDKSSERAPCNWFGVVVVEGQDLRETLLLNAITYNPAQRHPERTGPDDRPAWEAEEPPGPEPAPATVPRGWTDLLTWPSRRILLRPANTANGVMVDGVVLTPGTRLDVRLPDEEMMAAFRKPRGPNGKPKPDEPLRPVVLHPTRGIWRHSVEMLLSFPWEEERTRQRPRTLDHVSARSLDEDIAVDAVYTLRVFGQRLDAKASVVETWIEDEVPAPVALLRANSETLGGLIGTAITLADETVSALRAMERDFYTDLRATSAVSADLGFWPRLTKPFATFLTAVAQAHHEQRSERPAAEAWAKEVSRVAIEATTRWSEGVHREGRELLAAAKHVDRAIGRVHRLVQLFNRDLTGYLTRECAP
ncbi:type I-E CRISPR-associated protein Cse1/CasA [Actinokineospora sp. NPDC004072]